MFAALSDVDRARLVRLLGMLNSTFDAERATAGRLADKFIRERNLTWDQIIGAEDRQQHQSQSWRGVVAGCQRQAERLNQWERDFLASISTCRSGLTPKQKAKLDDIAERLGVKPAA